MKHIWLWWNKADLKTELQQLNDEGREVGSLQADFDRLLAENTPEDENFHEAVNALMDRARQLPMRADFAYVEPSDLDAIRACRSDGPRTVAINQTDEVKRDHIFGAWLGRCAGCLLGKPIEGQRSTKLKQLLDRAGCKEIPDYLWRLEGLAEKDFKDLELEWLWSFYRNLKEFPGDDDTNYTVMGMSMVKQKGIGFTPSDMADFWMDNVPILKTCTAERVAYRNFVDNIAPPDSASVRNPYREWIGAQIRADFFGYVALGRPEWAAELAWRDACISHVKNGIYGSMWVAAMLAVAMTESEPRRVVEIGLTEVPKQSRFHEGVSDILKQHAAGVPYEEAVQHIHRRWDEKQSHHWCHTVSNAQIVTLGLLYGEGDYEKAITRAVQPCFDTDCNGATVGSVMGMMLGAKALPTKWTGVMNDSIRTDLQGYQSTEISTLAEEMFQIHQKASTNPGA